MSQHVLKYTVLIPSWFPANTNGITCNVLISFFIEHKRSPSHYNLGVAWNFNQLCAPSPRWHGGSRCWSLLTPVRANKMPLLNYSDGKRARRFNTLLSKRRVKIEHVFKEMKTYKAIGQIWRHPRWLMPVCVELVALLSERRVRLFKTV